MRRFQVEQLIRDKIPEIMRPQGVHFFERTLNDDEFCKKLQDKLEIEAREVKSVKSQEELLEELADVLEVMYTLAQASGLKIEEIEKTRLKKRQERGGFDTRTYNAHVDLEESNPLIGYYLRKSAQYPEIDC